MRVMMANGMAGLCFVAALHAFPVRADPGSQGNSVQPVLWATLATGDSPQTVAEKLMVMQDIKSVRVKSKITPQGEALSISYKDGGISVIDEKFAIKPLFKDGSLSEVALVETGSCANTMAVRYERLRKIMLEKYPGEGLSPEKFSDRLFASKRLSATPQTPAEYNEIFVNDAVAVAIFIRFNTSAPPVVAYGGGAVSDLLASMSMSAFEAKSKECGGTGRDRADFGLRYMPYATFKAEAVKILDAYKTDNVSASAKL